MSHNFKATLIGGLATIALAGCTASLPAKRVADLPPGVAGIWQSDGYGYALDASGEFLRLFHVTPDVCVEDEESAAMVAYSFKPAQLSFADDGQAFYFAAPFETYQRQFTAIPALPASCSLVTSDDPVSVFNSFVSFMDAHYAFFDLYGVDWEEAVTSARPSVTPKMSDQQLYDVMKGLLSPLQDGHLELNARIGKAEKSYEPGESSVGQSLRRMAARDGTPRKALGSKLLNQYWQQNIKKDILHNKGISAANDKIQYGLTTDNIGYLAITIEGDYANKGLGEEAADMAVLRSVLDSAISSFNEADAKAVIIDLSVNFGGYDFLSLEVAGRFASERTLAFTKYADDAAKQVPFPIYVEPHAGERYDGPVVVVTSNVTVSAGEMMVLALRALPQTLHVGETTRGAHSDVLEKPLPNGWRLELSNEVYHDHEGTFWEGRGIEPHIALQVFGPENPFIGHVEAINIIKGRIQSDTLVTPSDDGE